LIDGEGCGRFVWIGFVVSSQGFRNFNQPLLRLRLRVVFA